MKPTKPEKLKPWGSVFEHLREQRGLSKGDVCRKAGIERPEYRVICYKLTKGPSVDKVGALLHAIGSNWAEWGQLYDAMTEETRALPVKKMLVKEVPTTVWGMALERLREKKDLTPAKVCQLAKIDHSQYRKICYKLKGWPKGDVVSSLLAAMGLTWQEWGQMLDAVSAEASHNDKPVK